MNLVGIIRVESELNQALNSSEAQTAREKLQSRRQPPLQSGMASGARSAFVVDSPKRRPCSDHPQRAVAVIRATTSNTDATHKVNIITRMRNGEMTQTQEPLPEMPDELKALLEEKK
jgi:hypothetical protein